MSVLAATRRIATWIPPPGKETPIKKSLAVGALAFSAVTVLAVSLAAPTAFAQPAALTRSPASPSSGSYTAAKPTVVLVHGAWADAAGWTNIVQRLQRAGYPVVAPPNPLRGLRPDATYISSVLAQVRGPIILVGHSYGGAVITNAATGNSNVKALVYIAAFAPDQGETLQSLNGSELGTRIPAVPVIPTSYPKSDGTQGTELTIDPAKYPDVFLDNELPRSQSAALAVEQRPLSVDSTTQASGVPAWKTIPSWYLVSTDDRAISPDLERFMAKRAGAHTIEINAPHLAMATDPRPVTDLILAAARAVTR